MISIWNYLLIMGITLYVAFMYQSTATMLLFFVEAVLFAVSFFSLVYRCFKVRGYIEVPVGIAEQDRESLVKLVINNQCLLPLNRLQAFIVVKDVMRGRKRQYKMTLPVILKGEHEFIRMITFHGTGNYEICLQKLKLYDITGVLSFAVVIRKQGAVQVMPEFYDVPIRLTQTTKNFYGEADVYDENQPGYDKSELFQVREYRPGDRLQNVHWKLTAKQDELIVKEHSLPKACPVLLFLSYRSGKKKTLLHFLEAVSSLSFSMMDAGCPHYVVWYDDAVSDVMRIRVDDEESLFYMIDVLMRVHWGRCKEDIRQRYRDKYRQEPYVWALTLDEKLQLYKEKELLIKYSGKKLKASLRQMELLL